MTFQNKKYECNDCGDICILDAKNVGDILPTTCPWSTIRVTHAEWDEVEKI